MAEAKRNSLKKIDAGKMLAGVYFATFLSGVTFAADLREIVPNYDSLSAMAQRTLQYGIKQKLDDSMAGVDNEEEALEEVSSTWDAIKAGNWTSRVPGEGVEGGLFARAYAAVKEISLADAKAKIGSMVEKNLAANQARNPEAEITERQVFNKIRDVALERDPVLKAKYDELKAKKATRAKAKSDIEVDLSGE